MLEIFVPSPTVERIVTHFFFDPLSLDFKHKILSLLTAQWNSPPFNDLSSDKFLGRFFRVMIAVPQVKIICASRILMRLYEVNYLSIKTQWFLPAKLSVKSLTTLLPKFLSTFSCVFPVYTSNWQAKSLWSHLIQTLYPRLIVSFSIYCFSELRPLNFTIDSSTDWFFPGQKTDRKMCKDRKMCA